MGIVKGKRQFFSCPELYRLNVNQLEKIVLPILIRVTPRLTKLCFAWERPDQQRAICQCDSSQQHCSSGVVTRSGVTETLLLRLLFQMQDCNYKEGISNVTFYFFMGK